MRSFDKLVVLLLIAVCTCHNASGGQFLFPVRSPSENFLSSASISPRSEIHRITRALQPPADPSNLTVTVMNYGFVRITWTDNSSDESGFIIERKIAGGSFAVIDSVGSGVGTGARAFFDTAVAPNTTFGYRVAAYNGSGLSGYSPEGTGTTPAVPAEWSLLNGPTPESGTAGFYGISFADSLHGIAVGNLRRLLKTTDGGASWTESELTNQVSNATLWDIDMVAAPTAFVSGQAGFFARTTDGGTTWTSPGIMVDGSPVFGDHYGIDFLDVAKGIVVGSSGVYATTDGGDSWMNAATGVSTTFRDIQFIDDTTVVVVGNGGTIIRSTDGGGTWLDQSGNIDWQGESASSFHAVSFRNLQNGYAVGLGGAVVRTTDGGASWIAVNRPGDAQLQAVALLDETTILVVGPGDSTFVSHDAGLSWNRHATGLSGEYGLFELTFQSPTSLVASGGAFHIVQANVQSFLVPPGSPNTASAYFDGADDRIRVLDSAPANQSANPSAYMVTGTTVSMEAWVYPMETPAPGDVRVILARPADGGIGVDPFQSFGLMIIGADQFASEPVLAATFSDGTSQIGTSGEIAVRDTSAVKVGEWTHIAGTYDGSAVKLYVDGALVSERPFTASIGAGSTGLYIGGTTDGYFSGLIDEVRLWNVTRSAFEVASARNITLQGTEPGLAGYWPMDSTYILDQTPVTPDVTVNKNDLYAEFGGEIAQFPQGSGVQIAPTELIVKNRDGAPLFAVTGAEYAARITGDGWPIPTVSNLAVPPEVAVNGDSIAWTPAENVFGLFDISGTVTNAAGSVTDTVTLYVEALRRAGDGLTLDVSNRGKLGAFGEYGKGLTFRGMYGLSGGDVSLVDRNNGTYAGGLYSTDGSFRPLTGFTDAPSGLEGFAAFRSTMDDALELNRIGVTITQTVLYDTSDAEDAVVILEYTVINTSGALIDDMFVQMTADFDVGLQANNLGRYDSTLGLTYAYEADAANDSAVYGFVLLQRPVAGHAVFATGSDQDFVRSTANLTTFTPELPSGADIRNQLSVGPNTLASGDSLVVRFAYIAAEGLTGLQSLAQRARSLFAPVTGVETGAGIPDEFVLMQNYPNPFNPSTTIRFALPIGSRVRIEVFNILGQSVALLIDEDFRPGFHSVQWDARVSTGLYFYRIEATPTTSPERIFRDVKKLTVLK